jgi:Recombinase
LEAAVAVVADGTISRANVIDGIADLTAKSLVAADVSGPTTCFYLLETTRAYAAEKLIEPAPVAQRHAEHFAAFFERAEADLETRPMPVFLEAYSFAQFEREVISERVRDKIAASKRKGLWVGGPVPLGYRYLDKKLEIVPEEAETVRTIFTLYLELGSVAALIAELDQRSIRTKINGRRDGQKSGGIRFGMGSLAHLLKNRFCRRGAQPPTRMVSTAEVFLPYAVMRDQRTLAEHVKSDPQFLLGDSNQA